MVILENHYMIDLPTDSESLASIIWNNSYDWGVVLDFIDMIARGKGIVIKKSEILDIIKEKIQDGAK